MNVFISRISSSIFWNIALALSSSSAAARLLRFFSALFTLATRFASRSAFSAFSALETEESGSFDVSDASDEVSRASEEASEDETPEPFPSPETSSVSSSSARPAPSPASTASLPRLYLANLSPAATNSADTALCAGVSLRYRSPVSFSVSSTVCVGTATIKSSSASAETFTLKTGTEFATLAPPPSPFLPDCLPVSPPPPTAAFLASAFASRSTHSCSLTCLRTGRLPISIGSRSVYAEGVSRPGSPKRNASSLPSQPSPPAGFETKTVALAVTRSPTLFSLAVLPESRVSTSNPVVISPSSASSASTLASASCPLGRCSAPKIPSRWFSNSFGTASSRVL
mmetsp:Transcript_11679/g.38777  ORF Transcript_11679/g.38777 Transcript_11679/m.38777 type:complete len:342 (-) Transcript_11679:621-1646(-)